MYDDVMILCPITGYNNRHLHTHRPFLCQFIDRLHNDIRLYFDMSPKLNVAYDIVLIAVSSNVSIILQNDTYKKILRYSKRVLVAYPNKSYTVSELDDLCTARTDYFVTDMFTTVIELCNVITGMNITLYKIILQCYQYVRIDLLNDEENTFRDTYLIRENTYRDS